MLISKNYSNNNLIPIYMVKSVYQFLVFTHSLSPNWHHLPIGVLVFEFWPISEFECFVEVGGLRGWVGRQYSRNGGAWEGMARHGGRPNSVLDQLCHSMVQLVHSRLHRLHMHPPRHKETIIILQFHPKL